MPFLVFILQAVSNEALDALPPDTARPLEMVVSLLFGLAILLGILLGVVALFGISRYGTKGILVRALIGILIPVLFILVSIPVLMRAIELAKSRHAMQENQP